MRKIAYILILSFCLMGCTTRYISYDTEQQVYLMDKGDKIVRQNYTPKEVTLTVKCVAVSQARFNKLLKAERDNVLDP